MSTRFHQWVDHALVVRGLTQILAEGSGCRWGHRVSLVTICDGTLLFDVKDLFDFASVPHPLSATTRSFCRYPGQITGHKCLNKAHRSLLNNFAPKQVYYLLSHRCQHYVTDAYILNNELVNHKVKVGHMNSPCVALFIIKGKKVCSYYGAASRLPSRSKRFTLHPLADLVHSDTNSTLGEAFSHIAMNVQRLFTHIFPGKFTIAYTKVLIHTAKWTGCRGVNDNVLASKQQQRGFEPR